MEGSRARAQNFGSWNDPLSSTILNGIINDPRSHSALFFPHPPQVTSVSVLDTWITLNLIASKGLL